MKTHPVGRDAITNCLCILCSCLSTLILISAFKVQIVHGITVCKYVIVNVLTYITILKCIDEHFICVLNKFQDGFRCLNLCLCVGMHAIYKLI